MGAPPYPRRSTAGSFFFPARRSSMGASSTSHGWRLDFSSSPWRPCPWRPCNFPRPPLRCSTPTAPFSHGAAANLHSRPSVADQRPCPYLQPLLAVLRGACRLFDEMSSCCRRAPCLSPRGCSLDVVVEPSLLRLAPSMFLGRSIKCLTEQLVLGSPFAMSSTPVRHLAALAAIVFLCLVKMVELLYVSNRS